jgi:hypothetical protein
VGKLCEMSDILAHYHGFLLQILELLLELDNTLRNMVGMESSLEFLPANNSMTLRAPPCMHPTRQMQDLPVGEKLVEPSHGYCTGLHVASYLWA